MKICDSHNDFLTFFKKDNDRKNYINKINSNKNIKKICSVVWTTELNKPIEFLNSILDKFINKNKKLILSIEDLGFINKKNVNYIINEIVKLKPFSCGIVWNYNNFLGGGALENLGLTQLGKLVVKHLEKNGIIIDTAHMNKKTFWDFCKITTKPIYNSHCNLTIFKNHKRNLNHQQIKSIINSNGFIGFSFVKDFISNNSIDCNIIAKQLYYFIKKYGENNIGIGSDFYGTNNLPTNLKNYKQFINLKKALKQIGLKNKIINKVFYKNFVNFLKQNDR